MLGSRLFKIEIEVFSMRLQNTWTIQSLRMCKKRIKKEMKSKNKYWNYFQDHFVIKRV